ncbi:type IV pilus modification PilV family protein [Paenibacillus cymbidii]|uniref:type IV pilus modification PilV family protein n=1 Tax=Paenibacillus cymbidii TaxID=1639034 RepID=UPI0010817884|nr:type II secretion system protein [Paenibacillus cymbidii]
MADERGISLIEILGAVTILSITSVTLMGYFISGMEKSADASRRNIAANLARLKAAEIRDLARSSSNLNLFAVAFADGESYRSGDSLPIPYDFLQEAKINGTTYRYMFTRHSLESRMNKLDPFADTRYAIDQYLEPFTIAVTWDEKVDNPRSAKMTSLDSYLINREGVQ